MKKLLLLLAALGVVAGLTGLTTPPVDIASRDVFNSQVAAQMEQPATITFNSSFGHTDAQTADVYYEESMWRVCDTPLALANDEGRFGISAGPLGPDNPQWLVESRCVVAVQLSDAWHLPAPDIPGAIEGRAQAVPIDVGLRFWRLPPDHV